MTIGIVNDNNKKLRMWAEFIPECKRFSHPSFVFLEKDKNPKMKFEIFILDRMYHGKDILDGETLQDLRETFPQVTLVLSSALHVKGEIISGIDKVIDQWPIDFKQLKRILEN